MSMVRGMPLSAYMWRGENEQRRRAVRAYAAICTDAKAIGVRIDGSGELVLLLLAGYGTAPCPELEPTRVEVEP